MHGQLPVQVLFFAGFDDQMLCVFNAQYPFCCLAQSGCISNLDSSIGMCAALLAAKPILPKRSVMTGSSSVPEAGCSPNETSPSLVNILCIFCRACITAKLGQQAHRSIHLPLNAVHPAGGAIPQTDVVIQRKGPVLMWVRAPDGSSYTTSQRGHAQILKQQEAQLCKVRFGQ